MANRLAPPVLLCFLLALLGEIKPINGSTPNVRLIIPGLDEPLLAKRADFGSRTKKDVTGVLFHSPPWDPYLCNFFDTDTEEEENSKEYRDPDGNIVATNRTQISPSLPEAPGYYIDGYNKLDPSLDPLILLVPRGLCQFERKAVAARDAYGASAILIYDSLEARYRWDEVEQRVRYPRDQQDYECDFGRGMLSDLPLDPPYYDGDVMDPLLDMKSNDSVCLLSSASTFAHSSVGSTNDHTCESQLCLVTHHVENKTEYYVCCAWDEPITMQPDKSLRDGTSDWERTSNKDDDISAIFVTIRQSEQVLKIQPGATITISPRPRRLFNISMVLMWILGVAVTWFATWYSATPYRQFRSKLASAQKKDNEPESQYHDQSSDPEGLSGLEGFAKDRSPDRTTSERPTFEDAALPSTDEFHDEDASLISDNRGERTSKSRPTRKPSKKRRSKKDDDRPTMALYSLPPRDRKKRPHKEKREGSRRRSENDQDAEYSHSINPSRRTGPDEEIRI